MRQKPRPPTKAERERHHRLVMASHRTIPDPVNGRVLFRQAVLDDAVSTLQGLELAVSLGRTAARELLAGFLQERRTMRRTMRCEVSR